MRVLLLPFPIQGHLSPFLMLARLLASQGFTCTFVVTEELAVKLKAGQEEAMESSAYHTQIEYATISSSQCASPQMQTDPTSFDFAKTLERLDDLRPAFETLVRKLTFSPLGVSCLITDGFVLWGLEVASSLGIPGFLLYTTNAYAFMSALHAPTIVANGLTDMEQMVDCIPGLSSLRVGDLPQSVLVMPSFATRITKDLDKAAGLILNSVLELEEEPLQAISSHVRAYTIGPMPLLMQHLTSGPDSTASTVAPSGRRCMQSSVGLWVEQRECLEWLSTRPDASVLFIAFGSLANMDENHIKQLAEGLEASEQAFLWVIRSVGAACAPNFLPEGFTERVKDRGLIISWAPQVEVLSHPAVGAFFTHCGWNSVTENLSLGAVPMICWPQLAEQRLNQRLLVNRWRVGLELPYQQVEGGGTVINSRDVETVVRQVMQGEEGKEMRMRALQHKAIILAAVQAGGSSYNNMKALGEDMKRFQAKSRVIKGA